MRPTRQAIKTWQTKWTFSGWKWAQVEFSVLLWLIYKVYLHRLMEKNWHLNFEHQSPQVLTDQREKSFSKQPGIWTICCDVEFVSNQLDGPCRVRMHESQGVGQGHGKQRCQWYQHKAGHHVSLLNTKGGKVSSTQVLSQKLKHRHSNVKIQNIWRKTVKQTYSPDSWTIWNPV